MAREPIRTEQLVVVGRSTAPLPAATMLSEKRNTWPALGLDGMSVALCTPTFDEAATTVVANDALLLPAFGSAVPASATEALTISVPTATAFSVSTNAAEVPPARAEPGRHVTSLAAAVQPVGMLSTAMPTGTSRVSAASLEDAAPVAVRATV
jgi:hypothetical protein